ncbi:MAG: hypothetical protein GC153_05300 [Alphaproteobacteria bacterium]|nr:hypothetical protein [Alphaproteobacteria bacterium]
MRIALVVAAARNGVIGANGGLPWRISDDLKWFKTSTMGKPVIMGRKTFDSIGKPLPGRENIVITRSRDWRADGVSAAFSLSDALRQAGEAAARSGAEEICVIGGAEIFRAALPLADRVYFTEVESAVEGDVYFPPLDPTIWEETAAGGCEKGPKNQYSCRFLIFDRRGAPG